MPFRRDSKDRQPPTQTEIPNTGTGAIDKSAIPLVSIVLPIRNEARHIARSLRAVLAQDFPAERMEVLVADGMSTDGTREIVKSLQAEHANMQLVDNPGRIAATGLNAAMSRARGEIIIRVDGHCELAPDYVLRCVGHLRNGSVDGVGGAMETIGENAIAEVIAVATSSFFGVGGSAFRTAKDKTAFVDTVPFPAYTRSVVERAGPYDEELLRNQDDEYNYRLRKIGGKILLASDVKSRYYGRGSLRSLWRQYFQYGFWKVRVMQKHPRQMQLRQFVPPLFMFLLLVALVLVPWSAAGRWMLGAIGGCYLVANLAASVLAVRIGRWWMVPLLPMTFATLHTSYGLGFLAGLVRFAGRWREPESDRDPSEPQPATCPSPRSER